MNLIEELRAAANAKLTPYDVHWEDTARRLMRQAADVIEAANVAIDENYRKQVGHEHQ